MATKKYPNLKNWEIIIHQPFGPLPDKVFDEQEMKYLVITEEYSFELGRHCHGYVQLFQRKRAGGLLKLFNMFKKVDAVQPILLSPYQFTRTFLNEDKKHIEWGTRIRTGKTEDRGTAAMHVRRVMKMHLNREPIQSMLQREYMNAHTVMGPLKRLRYSDRIHKPHILYLWGPTGIGKSVNLQRAVNQSGVNAFHKDPKVKWFGHYDQEPICIMEEFQSCINLTTFLRLCDGNPMCVETKGGQVPFNSPYIIITSNVDPESQYPKCKYVKDADGKDTSEKNEQWLAYMRRVEKCCFNPMEVKTDEDPRAWGCNSPGKPRSAVIHELIYQKVCDFLSKPLVEFVPQTEPLSEANRILTVRMQENMRLSHCKLSALPKIDEHDVDMYGEETDQDDDNNSTSSEECPN